MTSCRQLRSVDGCSRHPSSVAEWRTLLPPAANEGDGGDDDYDGAGGLGDGDIWSTAWRFPRRILISLAWPSQTSSPRGENAGQ